MFEKTIQFPDLEGNMTEKTFYFNINKAEMIDLNVTKDGRSTTEVLSSVNRDNSGMRDVLTIFQNIVSTAVGIPNESKTGMIKTDRIRSELMGTNAFSELLLELMNDNDKAEEFLLQVLPEGHGGSAHESTNSLKGE